MSAPNTRWTTAEELAAFPAPLRYELLRGKLRKMAPAGDAHGAYTMDLATELNYFIRLHDLGRGYAAETGFRLSRNPDTVLAPDFAFIKKARLSGEPGAGYVSLVPDLVLETRSPGDTAKEMADKIALWLSFGVQVALHLEPRTKRLSVHRLEQAPQVLTVADTLSDLESLPGFALPLRQLFV
ncbi:Uma2 family endonuclease [Armatimonas sp.]|uniref:Uma2 family endonuclease n=1 Tax=Armatimonas sp. TaxID=1872638 RepID=UPI0037529525